MSLSFILGILSIFFTPIAVYALWSQNSFFSLYEKPLSYARKTHTKLQFTTFFIIGTLLNGLFILSFFYNFKELQSTSLVVMTVVGLLFSVLIGLTTHPQFKKFHKISAVLFVNVMILWSFIFHTVLLSVSEIHGVIGLSLSVATVIGMSYFYFKIRSIGYSEIYFIAIITLWNIMMSTLYLQYL